MRRVARTGIAILFGVLWGLGVAVLLQQFSVLPLDPLTIYGIPLAAAVLSGARAWVRRRPPASVSAIVVLLSIPVSFLSLQSGVCEVVLDGELFLAETSIADPFEVGEDDDRLEITILGPPSDAVAEAWVEIGAIPIYFGRSPIPEGETTFIVDRESSPVGDAPGLYHIGGGIDGTCSVDGYVKVAGNPMTNPAGPAAAAAVVVGLVGAWWAGRARTDDGPATDGHPGEERETTKGRVSTRTVPGPSFAELDLPADEPIGHAVRFEPTFDGGTHTIEEVGR
jgi:hypothetical protein